MENKKRKYWQIRLWISFVVFIAFFLFVWFFFFKIQTENKIDGAPKTLRNSFVWNEEVWKIFSSNNRLSVNKPIPPLGKKPRVNGRKGLETALDLKNYFVETINGDKNQKLPLSAFYALEKKSYSTDFRCIEGWSEEMHYAGARFSDFMSFYKLGKKNDGSYYSYVGLETPDGKYYVSIDMESMLHDQTVLAYEMNQQPLALANGAPIRLIIPIKYGIKSLKRIGKITFSDSRLKDYWAENGYDWYSGL